MLLSLSIRDFVIVDQLDLEFNDGFTVLTGETGAGKSILVDALSLALGARGEGGITRTDCDRAEIIASFDIANLPELKSWLDENELQQDDSTLILRRVIYADGRSRAFINGVASTVQQLREAGDYLVDIYSQHAHHSLLKSATQRQILDSYAGKTDLAARVVVSYQHWYGLHQRRVAMERNAQAYADELAELRDQVRELAQLNPTPEDWEALQQEHHRLSHAASLIAGGEACRELLSESEFAVLTQLAAVQHKVQSMLEYDDALQEAVLTLDSALIQLEETDRFLNRYLQRAELDPERLNEVEARIQTLHALARKHRVQPEALSTLLSEWQARVAELEGLAEDGQLAIQESEARKEYDTLAASLSVARQEAAALLGKEISARMQHLALAGGSFQVQLLPQDASAYGLESVEFLVAGHAGVAPRSLAKVASGGELSRISLAIRVVTAQQGDVPTMIFDEVDVGIGGGVAEIVGQLLKELGERRQVLVITHLPQVAALGNTHLQVSKSLINGQTLSHIHVLDQESRVEEVARMLGGVEITATTRQHASEMLGLEA